MLKSRNLLFFLLITAIIYTGCKSKTEEAVAPTIGNEELTTTILKFVNEANTADSTSCTYRTTLDNNGNILTADSTALNLKANSKYKVQVVLLDETQKPVFVVSNEIKERANYHLFFFQPTPIAPGFATGATSPYIPGTKTSATGPYLNFTLVRTDVDTNNPPLQVGLTDEVTTGAASSGNLEVVLRHQPNAKNGTYAPGSTDLDVNFPVTIK